MDKPNGALREALTFDDVLLKPGLSELLPADADIRTRITCEIPLNLPIIASAMDTVRQVKMFESGMVVNPVTIAPMATLKDALALMQSHGISGIPVVEGGSNGKP